MSGKQITGLVVSILLVAAFAFCLSWTIINWEKVTEGMSGTGLYTQEDLQKSYEDGYNTALKNEAEYTAQIEAYRDTITNLNDTVSQLNSSIKDLQNQTDILTASNTGKDGTISALNSQITALQNSVTNLTTQVGNLTSTNIGLSSDLFALNNQLATIQGQALGYTTTINRLNSLVTYLSSIVIDWENRTEFLATYYVNGQIWDIQVIDHINTQATIPAAPVGNFTFIGWSLDGHTVIDPTQIPIVTDTEFQAVINVTATFLIDGATHDVQTIRQNTAPETPTAPSGAFTFVGWSLDGSNVVTLSAISQNTTYIAVYTYTVTFVNQGGTVATQEISHGNFATAPTDPTRTGYTFGGWSINGTSAVDVTSTPITGITAYTALWNINSYTVTFVSQGSTVKTQSVKYNSYAAAPTNPTRTGYTFAGWSLNGTSAATVSNTAITGATTFTALWNINSYTVTFVSDGTTVKTQTVNYGSYAVAPTLTRTDWKVSSWSVGGTKQNVSNYAITGNTTFTANWDWADNILFMGSKECVGYFVYPNGGSLSLTPSQLQNWLGSRYLPHNKTLKISVNVVTNKGAFSGYWTAILMNDNNSKFEHSGYGVKATFAGGDKDEYGSIFLIVENNNASTVITSFNITRIEIL